MSTRAKHSAPAPPSWSGGRNPHLLRRDRGAGRRVWRIRATPDDAVPANPRVLGALFVALFVAVNLGGVAVGRWAQNVATSAKVLALALVVVAAAVPGDGAGWRTPLATRRRRREPGRDGPRLPGGDLDVLRLSRRGQDRGRGGRPGRTLPRIYLMGIGLVTCLYLLLNAAFLHVLPMERIAGSTLVAGDVMDALFGARAGALMAGLALLVVLATLNANVFVMPRVVFGLARDGLAPRVLARVSGGRHALDRHAARRRRWRSSLAATGTFERLLRSPSCSSC